MESKALELYQKRLQNLPIVLQQIYSSVLSDECLKYMNDESLLKYKINRIAELVLEIMNSEKQKILIRVIEQYQQLKKKIQAGQSSYLESYNSEKQRKKLQDMQNLILQKDIEINCKQKELHQKNSLMQQLQNDKNKLELQVRMNKEHCIIKDQELKKLSKKEKQNNQIMIRFKKEEEQKINEQKIKIQYLKNDKEQLEALNIDLQYQVGKLKQQNMIPIKQNNQKKQRIENLNKHVRFLQQELLQVERLFSIIKQRILFTLLSEVKSIKKVHSTLKINIIQQIESTQKDIITLIEDKVQKMTINKDIITKFSEINNQIDNFIQRQIYN